MTERQKHNIRFIPKWLLLCATAALLQTPVTIYGEDKHNEEEHNDTEEHSDERHDEHEGHGDEHEGEGLRFSLEVLKEFGIALDTAGPGNLRFEITLPGEVAVNQDRFSHVSPRFSGLVKKVYRTIGDTVKQGEALALVESNESLTDFKVRSLMDGVITEKHIVIGEVATSESSAFTVVDLRSVWVELGVFPIHLQEVRVGQQVMITPDHGKHETKGVISYTSPTVDEHSRTATARVVLDNANGFWRPGQFVEGVVTLDSRQADLVVPRTALFTLKGETVVFVYHDGAFEPTRVIVGAMDSHSAEIIDGLKPGDVYASDKGFTIKAELEKGAFESGHSH